MNRKQKGIFRQLIINIALPTMLALQILGIINYNQTKSILENFNQTKNKIINNEIVHILEYRELSLELLEKTKMNNQMKQYSNSIVSKINLNTDEIEELDLEKIKKDLGMDPENDDIYIINREGIIVNSTFKKDLDLNLFSFGEDHKNYLLHVFDEGKFVSERFTIESNTKRLRKYTYQPTYDGKYIVEIGSYSRDADSIMDQFTVRVGKISLIHQGILNVDLYIGADNPFALNTGAHVKQEHREYLQSVFESKTFYKVHEKEKNKDLVYHYEYMARRNTNLYKGSVLCIVYDRSLEKKMLRSELTNFVLIFLTTISILLFLIYRRARVITMPIKKLVKNVTRITSGDLSERAEVIGNNEISFLTVHFNKMIEQLESYTHDLEKKVKERTREIEQQKEEIETQRDSLAEQRKELEDTNADLEMAYKNIEDSIRYAKRIQVAILPPDEYIQQILPNSFFLYLPKDIVSGDFYWATEKDGIVYVAAVDCTGHGVPGAFMSIVGNDQLNYAINVKGARKPDEILNELHLGVLNTLGHGLFEQNEKVMDGMDLALCAIDFKNNTLDYAGAFNPLVLIRDEELITVKADRFPIGMDPELKEDLKFTNHHMQLKKGDVFYIFSDGYADQFGGPNRRKFLAKNFRKVLLEIHKKEVTEQKEFLRKTIIDWMGNEEQQIDDILVFGMTIK